MRIITKTIGESDLKEILPGYFGDMIKVVVDVK